MITVEHDSSVAPYEQVRTQFADEITAGRLGAGAKLPTVRRLADDLGLAVNTVARAYRELEAAGLVETRGRAGTFVRAGDPAREIATSAARTYAKTVRSSGLGLDEAIALLRTAFDPG